MHDGIHVDKAGTPSVTICTDAFIETSHAMATMWGAPDYPIVITAHPIAPLTKEQIRDRVTMALSDIIEILTGIPFSARSE